MNRIRCTLQYAYHEGFNERLGLLQHAARAFAQTARWSEEHAAWLGSNADAEGLATAAFEVWDWHRRYDMMPVKFSDSFAHLVHAAVKLGNACKAQKPCERLMLDLCVEAVAFHHAVRTNK